MPDEGRAERFEVPRAELLRALAERAGAPAPTLLCGPPGAGKTTLLLRLCETLALARRIIRCRLP